MLLGEPAASRFDLNFSLGPVRVRVTPFFWAAAALLGVNITQIIAKQPGAPTAPQLLLIWIAAVFLSILVHEMGHAVVMRLYGISCHVVLYHFGGLAVPEDSFAYFGSRRHTSPMSQIYISAAGPAAQLLLAAAVILLIRLPGYQLGYSLPFVDSILPPAAEAPLIPNTALLLTALFLLLPSIYWALLNLLPVYPLDGGQIAREVFLLFNVGDGIRHSLILSIVTGIAVAVFALTSGDQFLAIMFGLLAYSSYATLQTYLGRGGGGSPW